MEEVQKKHTPASQEYGLGSFISHHEVPFDANALHTLLERGLPRSIIRSKGWVNMGDGVATLWNHTGRQLALEQAGQWLDPAQAYSEVVLIGRNLDGAALEKLFDAALVSGK